MTLQAGYLAVALKLQEAAKDLSSDDICTRLRDCIQDKFRGTGTWAYFITYFGDADSGDVVYSIEGDIRRASYTITGQINGAAACTINFATAVNVVPRTVYEVEVGESKTKPAGSETRPSESATAQAATGTLKLVESAATTDTIRIQEAKADYEIKLIAPGEGSSAFYPKEVLERDGPKVFTAGTHVYLNHPTDAEESARPEGDVANLAGVLTSTAEWKESHAKGPGLYSRMKVFADHALLVEEKAPFVGMSIRAGGIAESGKTRNGKPVLKELTHAESVDVVTRAGAGGMILTESARGAAPQPQESDMTAEEAKQLIESATAPIRKRLLQADACVEATRLLESATLPKEAKARIIERAIVNVPTTAEGEIDLAKFREAVVAESKAEGSYLATVTGAGRVHGLGATESASPAAADPKAEKKLLKEAKQAYREMKESFMALGMSEDEAKIAAKKGQVAA